MHRIRAFKVNCPRSVSGEGRVVWEIQPSGNLDMRGEVVAGAVAGSAAAAINVASRGRRSRAEAVKG